MAADQIGLKLRQILIKVADLSLSPTEIDDDDSLFSSKLRVDSIVIMSLMIALEEEFAIDTNNSKLMDFDFETVKELAVIIEESIVSE